MYLIFRVCVHTYHCRWQIVTYPFFIGTTSESGGQISPTVGFNPCLKARLRVQPGILSRWETEPFKSSWVLGNQGTTMMVHTYGISRTMLNNNHLGISRYVKEKDYNSAPGFTCPTPIQNKRFRSRWTSTVSIRKPSCRPYGEKLLVQEWRWYVNHGDGSGW